MSNLGPVIFSNSSKIHLTQIYHLDHFKAYSSMALSCTHSHFCVTTAIIHLQHFFHLAKLKYVPIKQ